MLVYGGTGTVTDTLALDFAGLSIPGGATVLGVQVEVWMDIDVEEGEQFHIRLGQDNNPLGVEKTEILATGSTVFVQGGPSDLWNATAGDIKAAIEGTGLQVLLGNNAIDISELYFLGVDAVRLTVYYSEAGAETPGRRGRGRKKKRGR
jgi:hypothetical protein